MRGIVAGMAVVVTGVMAAIAWAEDRQGPAVVGQPLPRVASIGLDPNTAESSERLLGTPGTRGLVVVFFATWCKPCVEEIDQVVRGKARLDQAGVRVLLVNLLDERASLARFVADHRCTGLPLVWDRNGHIVDRFGLRDPKTKDLTLPLSVVTDGSGVVRAILRGNDGEFVGRILGAIP